ncbi:hypothetical protein ABT313_34505, partial [Kribbella sp. NPDC000426]
FGDTRHLQHRRADALGIISDPRYTQELLTQARNHPTAPPTTSPSTAAEPSADPAPAPADTPTPAADPVRCSAEANPETAPGLRPTADPQTGVGTRSAGAGLMSGVGTRSATADGAFGPRDRTSDAPRTPSTPSTPADPARGGSVAGSESPPYDGPCDRTSDAPRTSPARAGTTAGPTRSPYVGPHDRSSGAPCTSSGRARGGTTAGPASASYDGLDAGDAHLADPIAGATADLVELREPPLEDGAGPYDPDPPSDPFDSRLPGYIPGPRSEPDEGVPMDAAAQRALDARLAQIKRDAYANPATSADSASAAGSASRAGQVRPGQTEVFVHLTDLTLATGTGVLRAEGIGPLLAEQLTELVGHGPYTVKPVIDLNDAVSVDAYEIPARIRERVRLTYPVELFPYGTRESHRGIDLDHIEPYDPYGPAGQTSTRNLAPLSRFAHRVKTHARGWDVRRVDHKTLEWTTPHGFRFEVGPTGTHRLPNRIPDS